MRHRLCWNPRTPMHTSRLSLASGNLHCRRFSMTMRGCYLLWALRSSFQRWTCQSKCSTVWTSLYQLLRCEALRLGILPRADFFNDTRVAHNGPNGMWHGSHEQKQADCKIGNHIYLLDRIHVRLSSAVSMHHRQSLSGVGRRFPTQFSVPRVFGLYWRSEVSAGANLFSSMRAVPQISRDGALGLLAFLGCISPYNTYHCPMRQFWRFWCLFLPVFLEPCSSRRRSRLGNYSLGVCYTYSTALWVLIHQSIVFSFVGVMLIARPPFLFGSPQTVLDPSKVTPTQRMLSVMSEVSHSLDQNTKLTFLCSAALIGVAGATCACEFAFFHFPVASL